MTMNFSFHDEVNIFLSIRKYASHSLRLLTNPNVSLKPECCRHLRKTLARFEGFQHLRVVAFLENEIAEELQIRKSQVRQKMCIFFACLTLFLTASECSSWKLSQIKIAKSEFFDPIVGKLSYVLSSILSTGAVLRSMLLNHFRPFRIAFKLQQKKMKNPLLFEKN
jgi:hypothetical protein